MGIRREPLPLYLVPFLLLPTSKDQFILDLCPLSGCDKGHFNISRDTGQYICFKCGKTGNLTTLKRELGDAPDSGKSESSTGIIDPAKVEAYHKALLEDKRVMDYLTDKRGFTRETISKFVVGFGVYEGQECIVLPYFEDGDCTLLKYRTLHTSKYLREKYCPSPLFNIDNALKYEGSVIITEGEFDTMALDQMGLHNVVSIPCGQSTFSEENVKALKKFTHVYLIYDMDPKGRKGVEIAANALGRNRCYNILLPDGLKDANEALSSGYDNKRMTDLLSEAQIFPPLTERDYRKPMRFCDVSFAPREHIVKGFPLDRKLMYVHSAEGGGGKSFIAMHLIKSILTKQPLFGKYEVLLNGPVLLFDQETPEPIMEERLNGFGLKDQNLDGYLFHFPNLQIGDDNHLKAIQDEVKKYKPILCVFDSLTRFHVVEENSNSEMKVIMMQFRSIAEMGPMIWLIHHVAKESKSTRGAAKIVNAVDVEFRSTMDKEKLVTLFTGKVRIEEPEPIVLKPVFDPGEFDVVYHGSKGGRLWEQIKKVLGGPDESKSVSDIKRELRIKVSRRLIKRSGVF